MTEQRDSTNLAVMPTQVWTNLAVDVKVKVIWLLSQLAFNLVTAQSQRTGKETGDVNISAK